MLNLGTYKHKTEDKKIEILHVGQEKSFIRCLESKDEMIRDNKYLKENYIEQDTINIYQFWIQYTINGHITSFLKTINGFDKDFSTQIKNGGVIFLSKSLIGSVKKSSLLCDHNNY